MASRSYCTYFGPNLCIWGGPPLALALFPIVLLNFHGSKTLDSLYVSYTVTTTVRALEEIYVYSVYSAREVRHSPHRFLVPVCKLPPSPFVSRKTCIIMMNPTKVMSCNPFNFRN